MQSRVLLAPRDLDASIDFYEGRLGLVRYRDWGERPHRGVVYFLGGGYLELHEGGDPLPPQGPRLWLQVGDIHAAAEELRNNGVVLASEPKLEPWGLIECHLFDPDGLELVLVETPVTHPIRRRRPGS